MSLTARRTHGYGSPLSVRPLPTRASLVVLTLLLACAKAGVQPPPPVDQLHYPAWMAAWDNAGDPTRPQLLVVNLDQDLAYSGGWVTALDSTSEDDSGVGAPLGGAEVPNVAGKVMVLDSSLTSACPNFSSRLGFTPPFALVAGRTEPALYQLSLSTGVAPTVTTRIGLTPFSADLPYGLGFTCGADGTTPRVWVSYQAGQNDIGYVTRLNLFDSSVPRVEVNTGPGVVRSFAYDAARDRLYFTSRESSLHAALKWIDVGNGCVTADSGIQDESLGGCHVDTGWDLGAVMRGAEASEIALSSAETPCTAGGFTGSCRRAYLSVRIYDADLAGLAGTRPSSDTGGMLWVVELPEGGLGRPVPQLVQALDIGVVAGDVHVIPRPGRPDLVAVTALDDGLLWIYDDELGAMVKVFGRAPTGPPLLGRRPTAIASRDLGTGTVRLFVSSFEDHFVSMVDVPVADPASSYIVRTGPNPPDPTYGNYPVRRWKGTTP